MIKTKKIILSLVAFICLFGIMYSSDFTYADHGDDICPGYGLNSQGILCNLFVLDGAPSTFYSPKDQSIKPSLEKRKQTVDPVLEAKFLLMERGKIPIGECVDEAEDFAQKIIDEMDIVYENLEEEIFAGNELAWLPEECKCGDGNCKSAPKYTYDPLTGECTGCSCSPCSGNVCPFDEIKEKVGAIQIASDEIIKSGDRIKDLVAVKNLSEYDPDRWEILNKLRNSRYKMEECVRGFESALKHPRVEVNFLSCRTAMNEIETKSGGLVLLGYFENKISDYPYCYPYTANSAIREICKDNRDSDDCHIPLKGCMDNYFCAGFVGPTGDLGGSKEGDEPQVKEGVMPTCSGLYTPPADKLQDPNEPSALYIPHEPPSGADICYGDHCCIEEIDEENPHNFGSLESCPHAHTGLENYYQIVHHQRIQHNEKSLMRIGPKGPNGETICMYADACDDGLHAKYILWLELPGDYNVYDVWVPNDYMMHGSESNTIDWRFVHGWKPAIYLYPEEKTQIKVKMKLKGKMTASIPDYENGWDVMVEPNGLIDKKFDYLFYETEIESYKIKRPIEGFLVKFNELEKFFDEILPRLGLQGKEIVQFKEWWLNKLEPSEYYLIKLLSRDVIDEIEAMEIDPKPDTVIRIRFAFLPIENKIGTIAPEITAPPERQGFTVVEWGGFIFKK